MPDQDLFRTGQRNTAGQLICGGKTRKGTPCQQTRITHNGRCRMHNGNARSGIAHPNFKHGLRSRYFDVLPKRMQDRYQQGKEDPELLKLDAEIALIDVRLEDLLKRVDSGESGDLWAAALDAYERYMLASDGDEKAAKALSELGLFLRSGAADASAWTEIMDLVERRRKVVESERKRMVEAQLVIDMKQGKALVESLLFAIKEVIRDPEQLHAIQRAFIRITEGRVSAGLDAGDHGSPGMGTG